MENNENENTTIDSMKEEAVRLEKLKKLSEREVPYKNKFDRTHTIENAKISLMGTQMKVCGRLVSKRIMGKLIFAHIYDINGSIQISISKGDYPLAFETFKEFVDTGDFIGVSGELYTTHIGEITIRVHELVVLSKALKPLPEKWHGINDIDLKYRQRYLDLISNEESREIFKTRLKTLSLIRKFLTMNDFIEVETPMLQNVASGAAAKPFVTKHNALDKEYFLRISPELYLKQVIAGGFDRVFEMNKNFRNEGMDPSHLQEFTMLEWYASYWDYKDNIEFLIKLLQYVIKEVKGSLTFTYQGQEFDFSKVDYFDYTSEINSLLGLNILTSDADTLKAKLHEFNIGKSSEIDGLPSIPAIVDYAFKKTLRPKLIQPTISFNYPAYLIPLARRNDEDNKLIDMFQLVVNGWEIVKAYSELVNPITQREAFAEQSQNKAAGDDEAFDVDEGFLTAMEHGFPPMSGLGIGIDRLVSLLCDQPTLRDVILFPIMK